MTASSKSQQRTTLKACFCQRIAFLLQSKYLLKRLFTKTDIDSLSRERTDAELEAGLNDIMSPYGTVFIKVRRDHASGMPFGHAQFTVRIFNQAVGAITNRTVRTTRMRQKLSWVPRARSYMVVDSVLRCLWQTVSATRPRWSTHSFPY